MFFFLLGCLFPISILFIWKMLKLGIGYIMTKEYIINPYSSNDDSEKEEHFRDIVESVNLIIPMYPIQKKRKLKF
jgi:hypothetical protein